MKVSVLLENTTADERLTAEHGLSLYLETDARRVLFDMGQTEAFSHNAALMGIDLQEADTAVLSHGHYDHGGGMATFLRENDHARVYLSRYAFEPHYNGTDKYIGLDSALSSHPRLCFTDDVTALGDGMTLLSCNERHNVIDMGAAGLTRRCDGRFEADPFLHEQCLLIEENTRRILVSGCSHKGVLNLMAWCRPDVFIGGFHFMKLEAGETLAAYTDMLASYDCDYYTGHCTGEAAFSFMKERMPRLYALSTGAVFTV